MKMKAGAVISAGLVAIAAGGWSSWSSPAVQQVDPRDWQIYRNQQYRFELRQAPDLTLLTPEGTPLPAPKLRLWFQRTAIVNTPMAMMEPPPLAVDIYDNPSRLSVEAWLDKSGVLDQARFGQQRIRLNANEWLRLSGMFQLFPNVFYFFAHGPFVYRFTPSGLIGELMVASVTFSP